MTNASIRRFCVQTPPLVCSQDYSKSSELISMKHGGIKVMMMIMMIPDQLSSLVLVLFDYHGTNILWYQNKGMICCRQTVGLPCEHCRTENIQPSPVMLTDSLSDIVWICVALRHEASSSLGAMKTCLHWLLHNESLASVYMKLWGLTKQLDQWSPQIENKDASHSEV